MFQSFGVVVILAVGAIVTPIASQWLKGLTGAQGVLAIAIASGFALGYSAAVLAWAGSLSFLSLTFATAFVFFGATWIYRLAQWVSAMADD